MWMLSIMVNTRSYGLSMNIPARPRKPLGDGMAARNLEGVRDGDERNGRGLGFRMKSSLTRYAPDGGRH